MADSKHATKVAAKKPHKTGGVVAPKRKPVPADTEPVEKRAKPDPYARLPVLEPAEYPENVVFDGVMALAGMASKNSNWLEKADPSFEYAMRKQRDGALKLALPGEKHFTLPICYMNPTFSNLGPYGDYNIDNRPDVEFPPADVVSSKFSISLTRTPRRPAFDTHTDYFSSNYDKIASLIMAADTAVYRELADPSNTTQTNEKKDHQVLIDLELKKRDPAYDKEEQFQQLIQVAHKFRPKKAKEFPMSNIRRRLGEKLVSGGRSIVDPNTEAISFSRKCFRNLYSTDLARASEQTFRAREKLLPPRFRGLQFATPQTAKHSTTQETKSVFNTAYEDIRITDAMGQTADQFLAQFKPGHGIDLRARLAQLKFDVPVSVGVVLRSTYKNSPNTFHNMFELVNVALGYTWDFILALSERKEAPREGISEDTARSIGFKTYSVPDLPEEANGDASHAMEEAPDDHDDPQSEHAAEAHSDEESACEEVREGEGEEDEEDGEEGSSDADSQHSAYYKSNPLARSPSPPPKAARAQVVRTSKSHK